MLPSLPICLSGKNQLMSATRMLFLFRVTGSHDRTIRIWSTDTWECESVIQVHEGQIVMTWSATIHLFECRWDDMVDFLEVFPPPPEQKQIQVTNTKQNKHPTRKRKQQQYLKKKKPYGVFLVDSWTQTVCRWQHSENVVLIEWLLISVPA